MSRLLVILCVFSITLMTGGAQTSSDAPTVANSSITDLIKAIRGKPNDNTRQAAVAKLGEARLTSDAALPALIALARDESDTRALVLAVLIRTREQNPEIRISAADLVGFVRDGEASVRDKAWQLIADAANDPLVQGAWLNAVRDADHDVRREAYARTGELRRMSTVARIETLLQRLEDDTETKECAVNALAKLDPNGARAVPAIVEHFKYAPERDIRLIVLLRQFGERGRNAQLAFAKRDDPSITQALAAALDAQLADPQGQEVTRALLVSDDPTTRLTVLKRLPSFKKESLQAFASEFVAALADEDTGLAALVCVRHVELSPDHTRALTDLLRSPFPDQRSRAASALMDRDRYPDHVKKALIDAVLIGNVEEPLSIIHQLGPDPRIVPALLGRLHSDAELPEKLLTALCRVGRDSDDVGQALAERIVRDKRAGKDDRLRILTAMWWLGPAGRKALPVLMEEANDANPKIRRSAVAAIGRIGAEAKSAIPLLEKRLKDEDRDVAEAAHFALSWIR
jgi:hypothetical protein